MPATIPVPLTDPPTARLPAIIAALASGNPAATGRAVTALQPLLRKVYDRGESAWQAGAAADFLAATLYASPRHYLRLHAHAPGALDSDLHTHKGTVHSVLLSGALTNTTTAPAVIARTGGLDVWQCTCRADGTPTQHRTGFRALVDPVTIRADQLTAGQRFTVPPGQFHRLAISPDPTRPTVTLCLFDRVDPDAPDAYVLTNRPSPVLADRDMTVTAARTALRRLLDAGPPA